jgi:hypothetical protein
MLQRQLLIIILCFNLAFPLEGFAASGLQNPLSDLLIQHRDIKIGVGSMELIEKHGKELSDVTYKLMSDPKNKSFLNSPDGLELKKHQELLTNYLAIKDHFEKCVKDKDAKRKLQDRILQSSFQGMSNLDASPCLPPNVAAFKSYEDFNNNVTKAMKKMVKPDFQNLLSKKIMANTAKSLLGFRQKFNPDFMSSGSLSSSELDGLVNDVCVRKSQTPRAQMVYTDVCQKMDPQLKSEFKKELIEFSKNQKPSDKISPEIAVSKLNASIDRLNSTLAKVEVKKDVGYIYDSANLSDEKAKKEFDNYINQYTQEVSRDAGALLLTSTMKDRSGSIKRFDSDETSKDKKSSQFQFTPHKKIKLEDVTKSIKEAEGKMMDQARDTLTIANQATLKKDILKSDDDDISNLVRINPFAAGQVLLHQPQYSGLMCDSINKINKDDIDDANMDKYFVIGSAVIGGALVLTGVGAVAGAYLVTGSLTAGVAAGTAGASILGYSALAGSAVELVSLGYNSKRSLDHYKEMDQLESAYLTKNSDATALTEAKNALVDFKEARMMAGLSMASMGLNLVNVGSVFNILKSGKATATELNAATKILKYVGDTQVAARLKEIVQAIGVSGAEKLDMFLLRLAQVGEKGRIKFLELLKDRKMTPEKYKEIIESSLLAAKNCSKV